MTRRIRMTASANADVRSIARWIARDSVDNAVNWTFELDDKLQKLLETPGSGTDRSDLRPGMRSSPFGQYLIFFKPFRYGIQVIRVIHGARDYTRFFDKD